MAAASPVSSNTLLCVVNRVCGILSLGIDCFCLHPLFPLAYVLDPSHALIQVLLAVNDIGHGEATGPQSSLTTRDLQMVMHHSALEACPLNSCNQRVQSLDPRGSPEVVFPHPHHMISLASQLPMVTVIPSSVRVYLFFPEFAPSSRSVPPAFGAPMPETAIDKQD